VLLGNLGKKVASGYSRFTATPQVIAALQKPHGERTRSDILQIFDACQLLQIFDNIDLPLIRDMSHALHLLRLPANSVLHLGSRQLNVAERKNYANTTALGTADRPLEAFVLVMNGNGSFCLDGTRKRILSQEELYDTAKEMFDKIDTDNSGTIDAEELLKALTKQGVLVDADEAKDIIRSFVAFQGNGRPERVSGSTHAASPLGPPTTNTGPTGSARRRGSTVSPSDVEIDFPCFLEVMRENNGEAAWFTEAIQLKEYKDVFEEIDEDHSGRIDEEEFTKALLKLDVDLTPVQVATFFSSAAKDVGTDMAGIEFNSFVAVLKGCEQNRDHQSRTLSKGESLGVNALLHHEPMEHGTLTAEHAMDLLVLEKAEFERVRADGHDGLVFQKMALLRSLPMCRTTHPQYVRALALGSPARFVQRGARIAEEGRRLGEPGEMFLIMSGVCNVVQDVDVEMSSQVASETNPYSNITSTKKPNAVKGPGHKKQQMKLVTLGKGRIIGEAAAFENKVADSTVVAATPVTLMTLNVDDIQKYVPHDALGTFLDESELRDNWRQGVLEAARDPAQHPVAQILAESAVGNLSALQLTPKDDDGGAPKLEIPSTPTSPSAAQSGSPRKFNANPAAVLAEAAERGYLPESAVDSPGGGASGKRLAFLEPPDWLTAGGPLPPRMPSPEDSAEALSGGSVSYKSLATKQVYKLPLGPIIMPPRQGELKRVVDVFSTQALSRGVSALRREVSKFVEDMTFTPTSTLHHREVGTFPRRTPQTGDSSTPALRRALRSMRGQAFRSLSLRRHLLDGDPRGSGYMRRFALPQDIREVNPNYGSASLLADPAWHPGTCPRLRQRLAAEVSIWQRQQPQKEQRHLVSCSGPILLRPPDGCSSGLTTTKVASQPLSGVVSTATPCLDTDVNLPSWSVGGGLE